MQVLALIARGLSDKQVARQLAISDLTARKHRENLLRKTRTHKTPALVALAVQVGWLPR